MKPKYGTGDVQIVTSTDINTLSKEQRDNYMRSHKQNSWGHEYVNWEAHGWAIVGKFGFYTGWWLRKKDAITQHCIDRGKTWEECVRDGDKAVKIVMHEAPKDDK